VGVHGITDGGVIHLFFQPFISLFEPKLHTPELTFSRCPFLFTVGPCPLSISLDISTALMSIIPHIVCAIALRYSDKPEVYPIAMHFAKSAASSALIDGWKSVELCQAYILMSIYAVPARRWEEDRSWLYTGLAIRCANLPQRAVYIESSKSNMFPMTELRQT
jgi:hypothetical protein